jgi:hypothetical protein
MIKKIAQRVAERALLREAEASQRKQFAKDFPLKRSEFKALSAVTQMAFIKAGGKIIDD